MTRSGLFVRAPGARALVTVLLLALPVLLPAVAQGAPDLGITSITTPPFAVTGTNASISISFSNTGDATAAGYNVSIYISAAQQVTVFNPKLLTSPGPTLAPGESASITLQVPIPNGPSPSIYTAGLPAQYTLGAIADPTNTLHEPVGTLSNNFKFGPPTLVSEPAPDFVAVSIAWQGHSSAGELVPVELDIQNAGVLDGSATVGLYLSSNSTLSMSDLQIAQLQVAIPAGGELRQTTTIQLPSNTAPGTYYLGMWIDPQLQVTELSRDNNVALSAAATIDPSPLWIQTSSLTDALLGAPYVQSLNASGGDTAYQWRLAGGSLPEGIALSPEGLLSGTAQSAGFFSPIIEVQSGEFTARTAFVLRAYAPTVPVAVTSTQLPPAIVGDMYNVPLAASGGTPPYTWTVAAGDLPEGLMLFATGIISGMAASPSSSPSVFTVQVVDANGMSAQGQLSVQALAAGTLAITQTMLPDGTAEQVFTGQVQASGGVMPYRWTLAEGTMPAGIVATQAQDSFSLTGIPTEAGVFVFTLRVEDSSGQFDTSQFVLRIAPAPLQILTTALPDGHPGQAYDVQLTAATQSTTWKMLSGELPPGVAMDATGHLQGTISTTAAPGPYSFLVQAADGRGAFGERGFAITLPGSTVTTPAAATSSGCAQTSPAAWALLPAALLFLTRRRRAALLGSIVAGVLALAGTAQADPNPPYVAVIETASYVPLTTATQLTFADTSAGLRAISLSQVSPPFSVPYYGNAITQFTVSVDGYLTLGPNLAQASTTSNAPLPSSSAPPNIVAPWWTELDASSATIQWALVGATPNRTLIVEWNNVVMSDLLGSSVAVTFQAQVSENGDIAFSYQPLPFAQQSSNTATIGIQNADGTRGAMTPCGAVCSATSWPGNQRVRFTRMANLVASNFIFPTTLYGGIPFNFSVQLSNNGAVDAAGVTGALFLSTTQSAPNSITPLYTTPAVDIAAGQSAPPVQTQLTIPLETPPGTYYPVFVIDPGNTIPESGAPAARVSVGGPIQVATPGPDLTVQNVTTSAKEASTGTPLTVTAMLANAGDLPALCDWEVVLAVGDTLSPSDRVLAQGMVNLNAQDKQQISSTITLPTDLLPGSYRVGVLVSVDPSQSLQELNAFNNSALAPSALSVSGPLTIATQSLPDASVGVSYAYRLAASGGNGFVYWSLSSDSQLPPGLTLSSDGVISGIPTTAGTVQLTVQVTSEMDAVSASLTLVVDQTVLPLELPTTELPAALYGQTYKAQLTATGGSPPYTFSLQTPATSSQLPPGLAFDETGLITGVPRASGEFTFGITLSDHSGQRVSGTLTLSVIAAEHPSIQSTSLPDGLVQQPYTGQLTATGGTGPYQWQLLGARLGTDQGTASMPLDTLPGLVFHSDGSLTGTPTAVGTYSLAVQVTDAMQGTSRSTVLLVVRADYDVAVLTSELPAAYVGQPYDQAIVAAGGDGQFSFSLLDSSQTLPDGLALKPNGHIKGQPTTIEQRTFIVVVTDDSGRQATRALTVVVTNAPLAAASSGGCNAVGAPGLLALLVVAMAALHRRRSSGAVALLASAALVVGCGSHTTVHPCDNVKCQAGETCDPGDGTCKCGGTGGRACTALEQCNPETLSCELIDKCTVVTCIRSMSCDSNDGTCKCGTEVCDEGTVCSPQEKRCVAEEACANVSCAPGLTCDPADGLCKCGGAGGTVCLPGQTCQDNACGSDPCASVNCTGGLTCDPADGTCKCGGQGGQPCNYGQTCNVETMQCTLAGPCDTVQCTGGMSCDPADGQCHCGGHGGPQCGMNQTCDVFGAKCIGGDQCAHTTCPENTTCDPEDGSCHCGMDGSVCAASEICANNNGSLACVMTCDPVTQSPCAANAACSYDPASQQALCVPPGTGGPGAPCSRPADCGRGLGCALLGFSGYCRAYCALPDGGCQDPTLTCKPLNNAPASLGVCEP